MVRKSYGKMRGSRRCIIPGRLPVSRFIEEFQPGDDVTIELHSGMKFPHPMFHGSSGKVMAKRGKAYLVKIRNKKLYKEIFVKPEYLRKGVKVGSSK